MVREGSAMASMDLWWGVGNTSAEAALVRGYSTKADTAAIVAAVHIACARRDVRIYYFHVDSDSNPSDGLSRDGVEDEWTVATAKDQGWSLEDIGFASLAGLAEKPLRDLVT
eukprot:8621152-Lingulodinium_polyedra.AAC.1